jgi:hypothetical protein
LDTFGRKADPLVESNCTHIVFPNRQFDARQSELSRGVERLPDQPTTSQAEIATTCGQPLPTKARIDSIRSASRRENCRYEPGQSA